MHIHDMSYASTKIGPRYSSLVKTIERLLWIVALFAFSSVFIFTTSKPDPERFLLNNSDLLALALGERITDPTFTGVTNANDAFSIGAEAAIPNGPRPTIVELVSPSTSVELNSGVFVFARSDLGEFDIEDRTVSLRGTAIITSSDGYRIDAGLMKLDLADSKFDAFDGVVLQNGNSRIEAGYLTLTTKENFNENFVLNFENGVKFSYTPNTEEN